VKKTEKIYRTAPIILHRRKPRLARRATVATFWLVQVLIALSAQTTAPISRSTVARDGFAKNLSGSA
jgi:hypothetical protein